MQRLLCVIDPERGDFNTLVPLMVSIENAVDALERSQPNASSLARCALQAVMALNEDTGEERDGDWCPASNGWVLVDKFGAHSLFYHDRSYMAVLVRNMATVTD